LQTQVFENHAEQFFQELRLQKLAENENIADKMNKSTSHPKQPNEESR